MKLAFFVGKGDIWDTIVRLWTASWKERFSGEWKKIPSHVEVVFEENDWFSARPTTGVSFIYSRVCKQEDWRFVPLYIPERLEKYARVWAENRQFRRKDKTVRRKYDWFCLLFTYFLQLKGEDSARDTCIEATTGCLEQAGLLCFVFRSQLTPKTLEKQYTTYFLCRHNNK